MWNYRRDIFVNFHKVNLSDDQYCKLFDAELGFIMLRLREFPKVYWIWNHRLWILENHPNANWKMELGIVNKLLTMDSRNFHGWQYRRIVIAKIEGEAVGSLDLEEFAYTTEMIQKNFSNFSAWFHRSTLIPRLLSQRKDDPRFTDMFGFLSNEIILLRNAMYTDPDDQSVWIYLRWLLTDDTFKTGISKDQYVGLLKDELRNVNELNELEAEDNGGVENNWCLKTIITIQTLIGEQTGTDVSAEVKVALNKLIKADPLRKNMYIDQLKQYE